MTPGAWVLKAVTEFPATRRVLESLAEHHGAENGVAVVAALVASGRLVMIGRRRTARYGLPDTRMQVRRAASGGRNTKVDKIVAALRGKRATLDQLHKAIGGSRGSLSVYVAHLKAVGAIKAHGTRGLYRYSA